MKNIILLHGAIGASDQLIPLENELQQLGFSCYRLDFSGHGPKDFTNGFGIAAFANELESFISKNKIDKPHVFGYSMGGYVALYLASQKPNIFQDIITLGTKLEWSPEIAVKEIKMLDPNIIIEKVPKFAEALKNRHGEKWKLLLQKTAEMMLSLGNNNILNEEAFSKITSKVFIGLADLDNMVSLNETDFAASKISNSRRFTLTETKHPIETVNAKALAALIHQFIS